MPRKKKEDQVPVPEHMATQVRAMALYAEEIEVGAFVCNWDWEDSDNARLLFLADVPTEQKADDLVGTEIDVMYWICSKIEIPDRQAGGMAKVVRTVLIAPDDQTISTLSKGIVKSVDLMRKQFGVVPYVPPISMVVRGASTGTGSDMLMLVPKALTVGK